MFAVDINECWELPSHADAGWFDEDSNIKIGVRVYDKGRKRKDEFIAFCKLRAAFVA